MREASRLGYAQGVGRAALSLAVLGPVLALSACRRERSHLRDSALPPAVAQVSAGPSAVAPLLLAPQAQSLPGALPSKPRLYVKNRFVFVRPRADVNADWLGFLWFGASVELRATEPVRGPGCATFYAIMPRGFVCVDGQQATLAPNDPVFELVSSYAPQLGQATPHRYAESLGAELHARLPGAMSGWPALPNLFHEPRRRLLPLSTVAYADERTLDGQVWLLTADLLWLNKAQVTLYPEILFHGVELGAEFELPLAFFRDSKASKYRRSLAGKFERSGQSFESHSVLALGTGVEIVHGQRYFRALHGDDWVREQDAVLPTPRSVTPWGARVGREDKTGLAPKNERQTWIEVSVLGGWLLAFEGTRPVFATLISAGRGGIPQEGKNTLEMSATPLGTFPISGKLATITLQAPGEYVHSEVPWVQNFKKPYAIHSAYWHDNWGHLQSGGCINVSPRDGKWLFDFSEPRLPAGWHAVRWQPAFAPPTLLVVHE